MGLTGRGKKYRHDSTKIMSVGKAMCRTDDECFGRGRERDGLTVKSLTAVAQQPS